MSDYVGFLTVDDGKTARQYAIKADGTRMPIDATSEKVIAEQISKSVPTEIEKRVAVLELALAELQKKVAAYHPTIIKGN